MNRPGSGVDDFDEIEVLKHRYRGQYIVRKLPNGKIVKAPISTVKILHKDFSKANELAGSLTRSSGAPMTKAEAKIRACEEMEYIHALNNGNVMLNTNRPMATSHPNYNEILGYGHRFTSGKNGIPGGICPLSTETVKGMRCRREPKNETVLRVPLPSGQFAYLYHLFGTNNWLYDFLTDKPTCDVSLFDPRNFKFHMVNFRYPVEVTDVCHFEVGEEYKRLVRTWRHQPKWALAEDPTKPYLLRRADGTGDESVGPERIVGFHQMHFVGAEELVPWILSHLEDLRLHHVPETANRQEAGQAPISPRRNPDISHRVF